MKITENDLKKNNYFERGKVKAVTVEKNKDTNLWEMKLSIENIWKNSNILTSLELKRGGIRQFRTLDAAAKFLEKLGGKEFEVRL